MNSRFVVSINTQGDMEYLPNWIGALKKVIEILEGQEEIQSREDWARCLLQDDRVVLRSPQGEELAMFGWFSDPDIHLGEVESGYAWPFTPIPDGEETPTPSPVKIPGQTTLEAEMERLGREEHGQD